jgi:2-dehydropantoate 2-reductase
MGWIMTGTRPSERTTIAVIGLGSIGGAIAGLLAARDRSDIIACVRQPIHRLTIEQPEGIIHVPIRALTDPNEAATVDWVLLAVKTQDTEAAAPWLRRLCGARTRVATLQNGIGHAERLAPIVGGARVVPTIVYYNGERLAPDRMRFRRAGQHDLAVGDDAGGRALAALLDGTGLRILVSPDFKTLVWRKLLLNTMANPITALTLQRQAVFRREDIKALCLDILREAAAVARTDGARFPDDEPEQLLATLLTYPPDAGTSMYFDRLAGRRLEIEALTGAVVAAGERHGIGTPINRALLALGGAVSDAPARITMTAAETPPA